MQCSHYSWRQERQSLSLIGIRLRHFDPVFPSGSLYSLKPVLPFLSSQAASRQVAELRGLLQEAGRDHDGRAEAARQASFTK